MMMIIVIMMMILMIMMTYREENDILPLHNIEYGKDHCNDKENSNNDANDPSSIGLDWRCGDDVPARMDKISIKTMVIWIKLMMIKCAWRWK